MHKHRKITSLIAVVLAVALLWSGVPGFMAGEASAASSSEIQAQIDALKEEQASVNASIHALENSLAQNTGEMKDIVARKDGIDQQVNLLHAQMSNITTQVSAFNLLIADKQEELDIAEENLETLSDQYKDRIRVMEEQGDLSYWSVIFKASSFSDLLDRLNMVAEIANSDRKRLEKLKAAAEEVVQARETLVAEKLVLEEAKEALKLAEAELEAKRAESDALLSQLVAKGEEYEAMILQQEKEADQIYQDILKKNDEYDKAAYAEWLATSVPPTTVPTQPTATSPVIADRPSGVVWYHPLGNAWYQVTDRFGMRVHPTLGIWANHDGIDLATGRSGVPIYASRTGVVTIATSDSMAGNYVAINHGDGYSTVYMHMTHYIVSVGQFVSAGEVIGYVGTSGASTGYHLDFRIAWNGAYEDPEIHIDF